MRQFKVGIVYAAAYGAIAATVVHFTGADAGLVALFATIGLWADVSARQFIERVDGP